MTRLDDEAAQGSVDDPADGIGPEACAAEAAADWMAERCPVCGRPLPLSEEGVLVW